ncbi:MAG: 2-dehydropantoate 2-reductase N-terminal domain-containing protein, partial [Parvularcula sp.]|nr:2-dehydropantoate 2-reductase N-terminal domain-containing protein [Parvularcula sp.]
MSEGALFVAGAGSWGTALACLAAANGHQVVLWARRPEAAEALMRDRENLSYLPGVALPENVEVTSDPSRIAAAEAALFVMPAQAARANLTLLREVSGNRAMPIALCSKGLE